MPSFNPRVLSPIVRRSALSAFVIGPWLLLPSAVLAATLSVPTQHPSIQTAINSASNGDRIDVAPGTYVGTIDFLGKNIQVVGTGGSAVTTIDAQQSAGTVARLTGGLDDSALLQGFTVRGGLMDTILEPSSAGIVIDGDVTIRDCVVRDNYAEATSETAYSGILIHGGSPLIEDAEVRDNTANTRAGLDDGAYAGVYVSAGVPTLRNVRIHGNLSEGSGIDKWSSAGLAVLGGDVALSTVLISGNEDDVAGINIISAGGMLVLAGSVTADQLTVAGNEMYVAASSTAPRSSGVNIQEGGELTLINSVVAGDRTAVVGAANITATYSNLPDVLGVGVTSGSPSFVNRNGSGFHLGCDSVAIDSASPSATATHDLDGTARPIDGDQVVGARHDMGAFEAPAPIDADEDGFLTCDDNCPDLSNPDQADRDTDGIGDVCDDDHDPEASDITLTLDEDTSASSMFEGFDYEGPVTYSLHNQARNGVAVLDDVDTGAFTYTPDPDYNGADTFYYRVTDSDGHMTWLTDVDITVTPVNDNPAVAGSTLTTAEDVDYLGRLLATDPDNDSLTFSIVQQPSNGTVTVTNASSGNYTFSPNANVNGSDSFTFRVNDGTVDSDAATVTLTVTAVNDVPTVLDGALSMPQDTVRAGQLTAMDVEGETLTFAVVTDVSDGVLVVEPDGSFTYTPPAGFVGPVSFTYTASDAALTSAEGTISITVTDVAEPPTASVLAFETDEDVELSGMFVGTDPDGDTLTYSIVSQPSAGVATLTNSATGAFTYTPTANANGDDSFTYQVSDGALLSSPTLVTVTVAPTDDPPAFVAPTPPADAVLEVAAGQLFTFDVLAEDVDDDPLTYAITDLPEFATFSTESLQMAWTPGSGDTGDYVLTLTVDDGTTLVTREVTLSVSDADSDNDGLSDALEGELGLNPNDPDSDDDTISDGDEVGEDTQAPLDTDDDGMIDALQADSDADGVSDEDEAGDADPDTPAIDTDSDGVPDYRDTDSDDDGVLDDADVCRLVADPDQTDTDADGQGDACEDDIDGDGVLDDIDNCVQLANPDQADADDDGIGDECDSDPTIEDEEPDEETGCQCSQGGWSGVPVFALLVGLIGVRRRRRPSHAGR